ncbi:CoA transferase [Povalibacter sp.]|uniref:CaiB/BaiF CoA transferase family protein n=1 Tax=Povalibacter sp. TaxID=1962978 RepID=UPI002F3FA61C
MNAPLHGVKIADFSWVGAGPRATKDLADYGATVIKIESRQRLDLGRLSPPFKNGVRHPDGSAFFAIANTSKRSVTINLSDPRGIEVAKRLVQWADVVVENFGQGYMERIGLSWPVLNALRPDIILVSVSVAGRTGPNAGLRGYGNSAAALSGLAALSGWPDRPPHMPPFAYGDVVAPIFATIGVLAALEHRRLTGRGQHVDVSQVEPLVHALADRFVEHQLRGPQPKPGNRVANRAPHGVYPCKGDDQWCAIAVRDDEEWQRLCEAIAPALLREERFATMSARKQHENELDELLSGCTAHHEKHALANRLSLLGVAAEAVQDGREVFEDPELAVAGHYVHTAHAVLGDCLMPGPPLKFSRSDVHVGPAPLLGEHNREVFVDMLGMSDAEVAELVAAGALQ